MGGWQVYGNGAGDPVGVEIKGFMKLQATYPTSQHATAAEAIAHFFTSNFDIDAVMLVNSCARGKATCDSCLDINILVQPEALKAQIGSYLGAEVELATLVDVPSVWTDPADPWMRGVMRLPSIWLMAT